MALARGNRQASLNEVIWRSRIDNELLEDPRRAITRLNSANAPECVDRFRRWAGHISHLRNSLRR